MQDNPDPADRTCGKRTYPEFLSADENFVVPDSFLVVLDMDEGTLAFVADGQYLGVAFTGLKGAKVYPIVSAVWGHCEITMKYFGGLDRKSQTRLHSFAAEPMPLMDICRKVIRQAIGKQRLQKRRINELNLPPGLLKYLMYQTD